MNKKVDNVYTSNKRKQSPNEHNLKLNDTMHTPADQNKKRREKKCSSVEEEILEFPGISEKDKRLTRQNFINHDLFMLPQTQTRTTTHDDEIHLKK